MPAGGKSTVHSRRLGRLLRTARGKARKSQEDAAKKLLCNSSKISRIESGQVSAEPSEVLALLELYGAADDAEYVERLQDLARSSKRRDWWLDYESLGPGYADQISLEHDATYIYEWAGGYIPGLIQDITYAKESIENGSRFLSPEKFKELLEVRRLRQQRIMGANIRYAATLWELAIVTPAWDLDIHERQLRKLLEVAERPNTTIRVLPTSEIVAASLSGPFSAYAFGADTDFEAVRVTNASETVALELDRDLVVYSGIHDRMQSVSLPEEQSVDLIRDALRNLEKGTTCTM